MKQSFIILTDCQEYRRTEALVVSEGGTDSYERAIIMAHLKACYSKYGHCYAEINKTIVLGKGAWSYKTPDSPPEVIAFGNLYPEKLADVYYADPKTEPDFDYRFKCWRGTKRIDIPKRTPSPDIPKLYLLNYISESQEFQDHWPFLEKQIKEISDHIEHCMVLVDCSTRLKPDDDVIEKMRKEVAAAEGYPFCIDLTEKLRIKSPYSYNTDLVGNQLGGVDVAKFSSLDELYEILIQQMSK